MITNFQQPNFPDLLSNSITLMHMALILTISTYSDCGSGPICKKCKKTSTFYYQEVG